MTIEARVGTVGGGKSYRSLQIGLQQIGGRSDRYVIANFPIKYSKNKKAAERERRRWHYWEEIDPNRLVVFAIEHGTIGKEGSVLLIVDEAGLQFGSDMPMSKEAQKSWRTFFALSRKLGFDVHLISQSERTLARWVRETCEFIVRHINAKYHSYFAIINFIFRIKMHFQITFWGRIREPVKREVFLIRKSVANRYDSWQLFNLDDIKETVAKIYEGKVVPAAVLTWLAAQDEKEKQAAYEEAKRNQKERAEIEQENLQLANKLIAAAGVDDDRDGDQGAPIEEEETADRGIEVDMIDDEPNECENCGAPFYASRRFCSEICEKSGLGGEQDEN